MAIIEHVCEYQPKEALAHRRLLTMRDIQQPSHASTESCIVAAASRPLEAQADSRNHGQAGRVGMTSSGLCQLALVRCGAKAPPLDPSRCIEDWQGGSKCHRSGPKGCACHRPEPDELGRREHLRQFRIERMKGPPAVPRRLSAPKLSRPRRSGVSASHRIFHLLPSLRRSP